MALFKSGHHHFKTQLQNTYAALIPENGIYIVGYKIDKSGINYPYAVFVDEQLKKELLFK